MHDSQRFDPAPRSQESDPAATEAAKAVLLVLDGTIRISLAEAGQMARWIFGSLFTLNMAGAAACVALQIGPSYKIAAAGFMLIGMFAILAGGLSTARKIVASGREIAQAMRYWLMVLERQERDAGREAQIEEAIRLTVREQRLVVVFIWISGLAFVAGMVAVALGIIAR